MRLFTRSLLFVLCSATGAMGAVQFRTLAWTAPIHDMYFSAGGRDVALTASDSRLSSAYRLESAGPLNLYRLETRDGAVTRVPVASLPVPAELTRALLILSMDKNGGYSGHWLDDSLDASPAGTMRVHNLSSRDLTVGVGEDVRALARLTESVVSVPGGLRAVPVRVAALVNGQWNHLLNISQPVRPKLRFTVIIRDARPSLENPDAVVSWLAFHEMPPVEAPGQVAAR